MPTSHYPNGFPNGVSIKNVPFTVLSNPAAKTFWVDSVTGSNGNKGYDKAPFATIDYAIGRCTANKGDTIYVAAGHTELVIAASGLAANVAGITIVFMGEGSNRATIDFGTSTAASMSISGANTTLINPRFVASIDALNVPIVITGVNCHIINAEYNDATGIDTTDALSAVTTTGLVIDGWLYKAGDEAGTQKQSHFQFDGVDNMVLRNIDIRGDFAVSPIENVTDELLNLRLEDSDINNLNATPAPGITLDAACTGWVKNVNVRVASGTTYVSSAAALNWDKGCLGYNTDGKGGTDIATFA